MRKGGTKKVAKVKRKGRFLSESSRMEPSFSFYRGFLPLLVKAGIKCVIIFAVEFGGRQVQPLSETLIVYDFPLAEKFQRVPDVGVVDQAEQVVVCDPRLLFGGHILVQVGEQVALDADIVGGPRLRGGGHRPYAGGVIHKIGVKAGFHNFLVAHVPGELMHHGGDHFKMGEFFRAYRSNGNVPIYQI